MNERERSKLLREDGPPSRALNRSLTRAGLALLLAVNLLPPLLVILSGMLTVLIRTGQLDTEFTFLQQMMAQSGAELPVSTGVLVVIQIAQALLLGPLINIVFTMGEELGWRGFLFPELQRITSFTTASLIGGVVWVLFHLPLILFSDYNSTAPRAFAVVMFFVSAIALTFVHNWFRARSGSVWPAVVLHASHNIFFLNVYDPLMARYPLTDFFVTEFGVLLMVIHVLMALYIWAHRRELDPKREATMAMTAKQPTAAD